MTAKPTYEELEKRIQELEQSESRCKRAEENFKKIFDNTQDAIFIHDPEGKVLDVNEKMCRMYGLTKQEACKATIKDFSSSNMSMEIVRERWKRVLKGEKLLFEWEALRPKEKTVFNVEVSLQKISLFKEDIILANVRNITERKQAEEALKKSEEKYQDLYDNAPDMYVSVDAESADIIDCNQTLVNELGYTKEEIIGQSVFNMYTPDSIEYAKVNVFPVFVKTGKIDREELQLKRKDGSIMDVLLKVSSVRDCHGNILQSRSSWRDITERKQLETLLQQAQKMEAIGTLAGGIAHDFNNILCPIIGHAEMLLMLSNAVPEEVSFQDSLNEIYTSALRARDLIKQILTFSRQDSNKAIVMNSQPIIKEALKLIRSTIPTTIEIKQNINPDCGAIKADPTQIHQIVMNLSTNAYHAMEETGGELSVTLKEMELKEQDLLGLDVGPGTYLSLTVADTGMGMDKDVKEKIFNPFFTTKEKGKGTGMGLSVVHGIVTSIGGAVHVHSEPGKGTDFHVYLPVFKVSSEEQEIRTDELIPGGTERILLVDDEEVIIKMAKQMLEGLGYRITSRISSIEALEAFRYSPDKFDLVITDMAMPNMAGDRLAIELTKIRPDIPILLCTGFSEIMSEKKAFSLGVNGFLMKPIVLKELSQKIRDLLDEKK